jgi:hypothetical protein
MQLSALAILSAFVLLRARAQGGVSWYLLFFSERDRPNDQAYDS